VRSIRRVAREALKALPVNTSAMMKRLLFAALVRDNN